jgi:protein SMG8
MFETLSQLLKAMALYSLHARGPASNRFAEKLAAECTALWQSGRQMCEQLSLTGHNCVNR